MSGHISNPEKNWIQLIFFFEKIIFNQTQLITVSLIWSSVLFGKLRIVNIWFCQLRHQDFVKTLQVRPIYLYVYFYGVLKQRSYISFLITIINPAVLVYLVGIWSIFHKSNSPRQLCKFILQFSCCVLHAMFGIYQMVLIPVLQKCH